jgi:small subunit ribosomal protein S7
MARRKAAPKRVIIPDPVFGDYVLAKFINCLMKNGKKSVAEKIVYGALRRVGERIDLNPPKKEVSEKSESEEEGGSGSSVSLVKLTNVVKDFTHAGFRQIILGKFTDALEAISPKVEVKSRRVGGATYQIPIEVQPRRRMALAMRWLIEAALRRSEKTMMFRLAGEVLDAIEGRGAAVKKREEMHRTAKANQAFSHYR